MFSFNCRERREFGLNYPSSWSILWNLLLRSVFFPYFSVASERKQDHAPCVVLRSSIGLIRSAQEGFWYHHAEPKYIMLIYWIPRGAHTLPANASHRVYIGAFIMNDKREVYFNFTINGTPGLPLKCCIVYSRYIVSSFKIYLDRLSFYLHTVPYV